MVLNTTGATVAVEAVGEGAETAVVGEIKAGQSEVVASLLRLDHVIVEAVEVGVVSSSRDGADAGESSFGLGLSTFVRLYVG